MKLVSTKYKSFVPFSAQLVESVRRKLASSTFAPSVSHPFGPSFPARAIFIFNGHSFMPDSTPVPSDISSANVTGRRNCSMADHQRRL